MKKMACFAVAAAMILSTFSYALADNYTDYYKDLSGGINGKQNTEKVTKGATGSAQNEVYTLSRSLSSDDPIVGKVRYGANGNPVTDVCNVTNTSAYYMSYEYHEKGVVGKKYYMKMQNTTGCADVTVSGRFTP